MQDRLQEAIKLRLTGHAEEAKSILLDLVAASPDDAEINAEASRILHHKSELVRAMLVFSSY